MANYNYDLTYDDIANIHLEIEAQFPNTYKGIQNPGTLQAIANRPSQGHYNQVPYPDIYSKCASLIEAIIQWHPFFDGNKRTALAVATSYMYRNKCILLMPFSAVRFSVQVAKKERNFQDIKEWVKMLTACNLKEYNTKLIRYMLNPTEEVLNMMKSGDPVTVEKANRIIDEWLALDSYPEYRMGEDETLNFLSNLMNKRPRLDIFQFRYRS